MDRISKIHILGAALAAVLAVYGCQRIEEPIVTGPKTESLALRTQYPSFDIETTKAEETVMVDSIFAYPFNGTTASAVTPIVQDSRTDDGIYYFTIPADASEILFTNVSEHSEWLEVRSAMPDTLLSITTAGAQGTGQDILFGGIPDYSGSTEESIAMTRAIARIRTVLKIIIGSDTVSNVQNYFDNVNATINGVATSVSFGPDFSYSYSGSGSISSAMNITGTACHSDYIYTFPTVETSPALELKTEITGSGNTTFRTALPSPIDAGKDYTITIYLHKDNTEAGFSIDEITFEDTFTEGSFNDGDGEPFELIQFSAEALMFPAASNVSRDVIVTSKLGNWTMTLSSEALSSYSVENLTTGESVNAVRPSISGNSGDTLRFTTIRDISGGNSSYLEASFKAEEFNSYALPLLQSNGHIQSIAFNTSSSGTIQFGGYCSIYEIDGRDSTLLYTSTGDSYAIYLNSGEYVLTGDHIVKAGLLNVSSISMDGCSSLMDFSLGNTSIQELDLGSLTALKTLKVTDAASLSSIDISGCPIVSLTLNGLSSLGSLSTGDNGLPQLETVSITDCNNLTELSMSGSALLSSVTLQNNASIANINFSGCSSLETLDLSNSYYPLTSLDLSGCTSLDKASLNIGNGSTIKSLDFSGSPELRRLTVQSNSSSDNNTIRHIDLDGCTQLNYVYLNNLSKLKQFIAPNAAIEEFTVYGSDSLAALDLSGNARLKSISLDYRHSLQTIDLSGCTFLRQLPNYIIKSSLVSLDISHSGIEDLSLNNEEISKLENLKIDSSALKTFYYYSSHSNYSMPLETLDFSGCSDLDSVYIRSSDSSLPLTSLIMDGCSIISSLRIYGLPQFSGFTLEDGAIDRFYLDDCDNMTQINLNGYSIRHVNIGCNSSCPKLAMVSLENTSAESLKVGSESTYHESLSRLSVNGSTSLRELAITYCSQLYLLNTSGCTALESILIKNNSQAILPSLDVSEFTNLRSLSLRYLPYIDILDLRANAKLENIVLQDMSNLSILNCENLTALNSITLYNAVPIDTLNLNNCQAVSSLDLNCGSGLKDLKCDGMNGLKYLNIYNSMLNGNLSFDLPSLESLTFRSNDDATSITLSEGNKLRQVRISDNFKLDMSACNLNAGQTLELLIMNNNSNSSNVSPYSLNLSGYTALDTLSLTSNGRMASLNIQGCTDLKLLNLDYSNSLSSLDITGCSSLLQVDLYSCGLDETALETFYGQLPARQISDLATYRVTNNPGAETADATQALNKNWVPTTNSIGDDIQ